MKANDLFASGSKMPESGRSSSVRPRKKKAAKSLKEDGGSEATAGSGTDDDKLGGRAPESLADFGPKKPVEHKPACTGIFSKEALDESRENFRKI